MIQIRHINGSVLYTAEHAQDVRNAVEEARRAGAYLEGAYLEGAYLEGANLEGAYLEGAYLRGANLRGAYLEGAYLRGANLRGANLRGANLRGAYLRGAYLRGAYLRGAYLEGANLRGAYLEGANLEGANLEGANLRGANLRGANLEGANLEGANLRGANLRGANLRGAYLRGAYLRGAYLRGAYLEGASGLNPLLVNDLLMLYDQVGKIRAYKLVTKEGTGPYYNGLYYKKGETVEVKDANTDITQDCGAGINVATLPWCMREWKPGHRILIVEFTKEDIACIPTASDGKFRLHRCKVVGEKNLVEIGLVEKED